ncbi:MAG: N-acetyltransferase [Balneolaceae bacterium]
MKANMKNISIRQEQRKDYDSVFEVIRKAFEDMEMTDHQEQFLVQRLRTSDAFVPELSLVAEHENEIIGHILLTNVRIKNGWQEFQSLALAPVTVLPGYQKQGIGGMLIKHAHKRAKELGFLSQLFCLGILITIQSSGTGRRVNSAFSCRLTFRKSFVWL